MIETKIFAKPKNGGGGGGSASSTNRYISGTISEAEHAARADKAKKADAASQADYASSAGSAKVADYARKAEEVDAGAEVLQNYLRKDHVEDDADGNENVEEVDNAAKFDRDVEFVQGFTADGMATFLKGLTAEEASRFYESVTFMKDIFCKGTAYSNSIDNSGTITTKNLMVTGSAHFFELVIDKVKSAGGAALFTPADGFDVDLVTMANDNYRLLWRCRDGNGKQRDNMWRKGDQALCMSFNRASVGASHNASNKYYWALVTGVSDNASPYLLKDEYYNYIDISRTDCDGTVNPEKGDSIVMLGYRGTDDTDRQSAIYISAYTSLDSGLIAPLFAQYRGITDFDLAKHRTTYHDARGSKVVGQFELESGKSIEDYVKDCVGDSVDEATSAFKGQLNATAEAMTSQYKELSGKYDNLPLKSQSELTEYSSRIEQTARKISMSVSEKVVGLRNLLVGSDFKRLDDVNVIANGTDGNVNCRLRSGDQVDGYNSCRIIDNTSTSTANHGVRFSLVPVKGGTKYTLSVLAKRMSSSLGNGCSAIIHELANPNVGDTVLSGSPSWNLLTTSDALNTWVEKSFTFTTNSATRYLEVYFVVRTTGTFSICKPILEEGDTYNGYSKSENDYNYIGGNLIDNSRELNVGGTLNYIGGTRMKAVGDEYAYTLLDAAAQTGASAFRIGASLSANKDYVLSWYVKRTGGTDNGQVTVNFRQYVQYAELYTGDQSTYSQEREGSPHSGYFGIPNVPMGNWVRMWVHFRLYSDFTSNDLIYVQLYGGSSFSDSISAYFSRPKLEEGACPTEWTDNPKTYVEEGSLANRLYDTGIDIEGKQVTVTADNFKVRNNSGVETMMVTKDGTINASLVQADRLLCRAANGVTVSIHDGLIYFGGENGVTNIKLGTDENGCAILEFYDQNGVKRYDLGPNGLANTEMTTAQVVTKSYYNLVTLLGVGMGTACASITHTSAGSTHTVTRTFYEIREAYERKLFGYPVGSGRGVSLPTATELYQYQAGLVKNGSIKTAKEDSLRGLTSEMAKKADGLYFTSKTTMGDGSSSLKNLATGTFIASLSIKENNFRQAVLLDTYDYIEVPAYYVVIYEILNGVITSRWLYSHTTTRQYGSGWGLDQLPSTIDEM